MGNSIRSTDLNESTTKNAWNQEKITAVSKVKYSKRKNFGGGK